MLAPGISQTTQPKLAPSSLSRGSVIRFYWLSLEDCTEVCSVGTLSAPVAEVLLAFIELSPPS